MGKIFRFSLQKVLNFKSRVEDDRALEFKRRQSEVRKQEEKLTQLSLRKKAMQHQSRGSTSLQEMRLNSAYVDQLTDELHSGQAELEQRQSVQESAREDLLQATQEKKAIENLKERKHLDFQRQERQREAIRENEIAIRISQKEATL